MALGIAVAVTTGSVALSFEPASPAQGEQPSRPEKDRPAAKKVHKPGQAGQNKQAPRKKQTGPAESQADQVKWAPSQAAGPIGHAADPDLGGARPADRPVSGQEQTPRSSRRR